MHPASAALWLGDRTARWLQRRLLLLLLLLHVEMGLLNAPAAGTGARATAGPMLCPGRARLWVHVLPPAAGLAMPRPAAQHRAAEPAHGTNRGQDLPVWNKNQTVSAHVPRRNLHVYRRRTLSSPRWNGRRVLHGETEHSQRPNVQGWVCKLTCSAVC